MRTRKQQVGFSLIEVTVTTVVISILATAAVPKYLGVQEDTKRATATGMAGALGSASSANYVLRAGKGAGAPIADCTEVATLMLPGAMTGFSIAPQAIPAGSTATCTVDHNAPGAATSATFIAHGVS
jgi:prepilin-type N-terminal cleavage/methylation domain-containing protein